jgi:hypothetical protein
MFNQLTYINIQHNAINRRIYEINTKQAVLEYYKRFKSGSLNVKTESVERFSRRSLTGELAKLLNTL